MSTNTLPRKGPIRILNTRHMLNSSERDLVRQSWAAVEPLGPAAAVLFYDRLFELDPSLRGMFAHTDMSSQHTKLLQMIGVAVASLDKLDSLAPAVEALGRRHIGYGVTDSHYATVGTALLWTLEQGLGESFNPDVRRAWVTTYELLSGIMRSAAASATGRGAGYNPHAPEMQRA